ncbi:MAG: VIT1/CCC1 transporter family protein, partial [Acidobacteria bacterium]|nr:VIT1/CCC1 transporter family protein [Acidobacteriota bacterium]
ELRERPEGELQELTDIYVSRGLAPALARQVAEQLTAKDALSAHARDELGISEHSRARPLQAAFASAAAFASGASLPLLVALAAPLAIAAPAVGVAALAFLALLGAAGARLGGARIWRPVARVTFWGALAMALSAAIGSALGVVV